LRKRFGLPSIQDTLSTRIIVMELMLDGEATVLGGMADSVHEVIELDASEINPPPRIAMRWRTEFIKGMGRRGEDFLIILDVNAVFAAEEVNLMQTESAAEQLEPSAA
jgi:purine-binding chemotaxis protein CheW